MRRSLRGKRNEAEFRFAQAELLELRAADVAGQSASELWYMDQAGFTLEPCVPYAWTLVGETLELASSRSRRQNVVGFLNLRSQFHSFSFEGTIDTQVTLECLYWFSRQIEQRAIVVIDNAPIHTSEEFEDELDELQKCGVTVKYLPAYSPELNLIEILWRKIKYEWLPLDAYKDFKTMTQALFEILKGVGSKYRITFA